MTTPVAVFNYSQAVANSSTAPFITIIMNRAPTGNDGPQQRLQVTQRWIDTSDDNAEYFLLTYSSLAGLVQAVWVQLNQGTATLSQLTGNIGIATAVAGNINVVGNVVSGISTVGGGDTLTATLSNIPNSSLANSSISLVAGPGISISVSPVSLGGATTISNTGTQLVWNLVTSGTQNLVANNGYISDFAGPGQLTYTLPSTAPFGTVIRVTGMPGVTQWEIEQNAGQSIAVGTDQTTLGVSGSITSTSSTDSINLVCAVADTTFIAIDWVGNLTVV